jgi:hypothetical protein
MVGKDKIYFWNLLTFFTLPVILDKLEKMLSRQKIQIIGGKHKNCVIVLNVEICNLQHHVIYMRFKKINNNIRLQRRCLDF